MMLASQTKNNSIPQTPEDTCSGLDKATIENLYKKYGKMIELYCLRILGNQSDAADVSQEVFLRLISKGAVFRQEAEEKAWFYRVARNICFNRLKYEKIRDKNWKTDASAFQSLAQTNAETAIQTKNLMEKTLQTCDSITAKAVSKHFIERMTQKSVGKSLGLSRVSINKRIMDFRTSFCTAYYAAC